MLKNRHQVRIEWGDCDPAGIVYFPRYFHLFNNATCAIFESIGFRQALLFKTYGALGFPVVDASAKFHVPCSFGDDVLIDTLISACGRSSFKVEHQLFREGILAVESFETRVWTVRDDTRPRGIRAQAIPEDLKRRMLGGSK